MQGRFLDDTFNDVYNILKFMNMALAGFAFVAFALALIGLFGLAAFMAAQRTKEIGVRKVLGANSFQIARLLVWQFSTPVLWALAIALPAAYFAASTYLNFFADRIHTTIPVLIAAGIVATLLAWGHRDDGSDDHEVEARRRIEEETQALAIDHAQADDDQDRRQRRHRHPGDHRRQ